jgi:branched-chain amino acid transport system substrate-binding protein
MTANLSRRTILSFPLAGLAGSSLGAHFAAAAEPVKIGLVAALSGASAKSGEGITRGLTVAIDEINSRRAHGRARAARR